MANLTLDISPEEPMPDANGDFGSGQVILYPMPDQIQALPPAEQLTALEYILQWFIGQGIHIPNFGSNWDYDEVFNWICGHVTRPRPRLHS